MLVKALHTVFTHRQDAGVGFFRVFDREGVGGHVEKGGGKHGRCKHATRGAILSALARNDKDGVLLDKVVQRCQE
ncbi:hypothetical protein GCM10023213_21170 [Prosthecobacter algae]|uniref:Uncharacterized protein n=1 Tax=Prosthecobacter algae TaxID=1144682 RepID=A0ABP9P5N8_9BACT